MDDVESQIAQGKGEVLVDRIFGDAEQETDYVERPHVIVFGAFPDLAEGEPLAVVHAAFVGVVADDCMERGIRTSHFSFACWGSCKVVFLVGRSNST